jgi:hypothetical protein
VGRYDSELVFGAEDWKMSVAMAASCKFAVVREHLVGYRQSSGSMSRNTAAMQRAFNSVSHWIRESWPNFPKKVYRQMNYHMNAYLAHRALMSGNKTEAWNRQLNAYTAHPLSLLTNTGARSLLRLIAHGVGVRRQDFHSRSNPMLFQEFVQSETLTANLRYQESPGL